MNANGRRHDVWLIYRCPQCGARRKRRLHHRVPEGAGGVALDRYRRDDPALAEAHAFDASPRGAVPYAVERPALPSAGAVRARIEQPLPCDVRWDRFLARELGRSRSAIASAWRAGRIRITPDARPSAPVRDGQRLELVR